MQGYTHSGSLNLKDMIDASPPPFVPAPHVDPEVVKRRMYYRNQSEEQYAKTMLAQGITRIKDSRYPNITINYDPKANRGKNQTDKNKDIFSLLSGFGIGALIVAAACFIIGLIYLQYWYLMIPGFVLIFLMFAFSGGSSSGHEAQHTIGDQAEEEPSECGQQIGGLGDSNKK